MTLFVEGACFFLPLRTSFAGKQVFFMLLTPFHGFCMALADSVPGVSGGTIAFILGFYDRFLASLAAVFGRDRAARSRALRYLLRLGAGWAVGMAASILALSRLFEANIYYMSSLFLGLTCASIPFIILAERPALRRLTCAPFLIPGAALVVGLTLLRSSAAAPVSISFSGFSPLSLFCIFLSGAAAVTAMVLPGISGSSILLITGVYLPALQAVRSFFGLHFAVLPGLCALGFGVLAGAAFSIHGIRAALCRYRSQMVWFILGLMLGSLYAIVNGPASVNAALPPLNADFFQFSAFLLGIFVLLALELMRRSMAQKRHAAHAAREGGSLS